MNGNSDPLDDILAMVLFGVLDPNYLTGEDERSEKPRKNDRSSGTSGDKEKKS